MAKELTPEELQGIKARVAKGRLQGGNPTGGDLGPFYFYHLALDDLDTLIADAEARPSVPPTPAPFTVLDATQPPFPHSPNRPPDPRFHPGAAAPQPPRLADLTPDQQAALLANMKG